MGTLWMPSADRDSRAWTRNPMSRSTGAVRCIVHTTENDPGTSPASIVTYMANHPPKLQGGYHVVMDTTGKHKPVQLRPFNVAAGSLRNNGTLARSPNKEGTVLIQVSLVARAAQNPCLRDLGPWWPEFLACVRSFGVPDTWVGPLPAGGGVANKMPLSTWYSGTSGWASHATSPNPTSPHWDPGQVDPAHVYGGASTQPPPTTTPPTQPPPSGTAVIPVEGGGQVALPVMKQGYQGRPCRQWQALLQEWGMNPGTHDGIFGGKTDAATKQFQQSRGLAADGIVGTKTWSSGLGV